MINTQDAPIEVIEGSLEIVEASNGYHLYGKMFINHFYATVHLAHMGDGVDSIVGDPLYDPNYDYDLAEAYGFEIL